MDKTITSVPANRYAENFSSPEDAVSAALNAYTVANVRGAGMLSGHLQGNFLKMISLMVRPRNVLELGTYTGYATIALAAGLQDGGHVHTIDTDSTLQDVRDSHWKEAGLAGKIIQHTGKALDILPTLRPVPFDLAFIDADKGNYKHYLDLLLEMMPADSTIIIDNTLFHGEVFDEATSDRNAIKIHDFNQYLQQLPDVFHVLLPIRDGITLVRKTR